jgi:hypothetical protein
MKNCKVLLKDTLYMQDGSGNKLRLTPKKLLKQESRLLMPSIHSPAGPSAVRSPSFQMSGYVVFSLRELRRSQFTLNKVTYYCLYHGLSHYVLSIGLPSSLSFCYLQQLYIFNSPFFSDMTVLLGVFEPNNAGPIML